MSESVAYTLQYSCDFAILEIQIPEVDLEHEDSIVLEVQERELVFTVPPYHVRIPTEQDLQPMEVFPKNIDYEKGIIVYNIPLSKHTADEGKLPQASHSYGFGDFYSGALNIVNSQDFKSLSNPEAYSNEQRKNKRLADERHDFNPEHFGMDHVQNLIDGFGLDTVDIPTQIRLTNDQKYRIKMIIDEKKREVDKYQSLCKDESICTNLVDIVLAVLYDQLVNSNELNEAISHVNIHRISSSLSYFEMFSSQEDVLVAFYRRCCIYPLFRSKSLSRKCVEQFIDATKQEFALEWFLDKLLYCYDAFKANECVVLNHYYIKDCIRFVQICTPIEMLRKTGNAIEKLLPLVHDRSLGFGEEAMARKFVRDIIGANEDSTDSDDTSGSSDAWETESDSSDDEASRTSPEESVLDKLMNLKIQI
ncbi:protein SHQ1 homolog [Ochlerotatus camptorhynchus]|uniref:protein SHQ1 homolog n=1 Tax=Ochlerotatus camptorhynchus TaxID=644619 RepID=UPI0031DF46D8